MQDLINLLKLEAKDKIFTNEKIELELPVSKKTVQIEPLLLWMGDDEIIEKRLRRLIPRIESDELNDLVKQTYDKFTKSVDKLISAKVSEHQLNKDLETA